MKNEERFEVAEYFENWLKGTEVVAVHDGTDDREVFWAVDTDKICMTVGEDFDADFKYDPFFNIESLRAEIHEGRLVVFAIEFDENDPNGCESELLTIYGDIENLDDIADAVQFYTAVEGQYELTHKYQN